MFYEQMKKTAADLLKGAWSIFRDGTICKSALGAAALYQSQYLGLPMDISQAMVSTSFWLVINWVAILCDWMAVLGEVSGLLTLQFTAHLQQPGGSFAVAKNRTIKGYREGPGPQSHP